jgi:uncharacterized membrane protein
MLEHPMVVHAPIMLIPIGVVVAALAWLTPWKHLRPVGLGLLAGGWAGAFLANRTGDTEEEKVETMQPWAENIPTDGLLRTLGSDDLFNAHYSLGETVQTLSLVLLVGHLAVFLAMRYRPALVTRFGGMAQGLLLVVGVVSIVWVVLTGQSGGMLVHDYGVGVFPSPIPGASD